MPETRPLAAKNRSGCCFLAGWFLLFCCALPQPVWGFSLGSMEVISSFGEKFNAEIGLKANPDKPLSVRIGSQEDYEKAGLSRPSVVDELVLPGKIEIRDGRQILRVVSPLPLFHPSFNLVVRAEQGGNVIMENYLISVDFKQSVTLRLKAEREQDLEVPAEPEPEPEALAGTGPMEEEPPSLEPENTEPETESAAVNAEPETETAPAAVNALPPVVVAVHPAPLVVRELAEPATREVEPLPTPHTEPAPPAQPQVVIPLPEKPEAEPAPKPQVVERVARAPAPERQIHEPEDVPAGKPASPEKTAVSPLVVAQETYGPLKRGESLDSIVTDLKLGETRKEKAAVALWMDNRDKFIKGNMHGLAAGVELNLTSFEARLKEVSDRRAHWLVQNHWQEWELIRDRLKLASEIDLDPLVAELLAAPPKKDVQSAIVSRLEEWRSSWEKGDLGQHLALFSKQPPVPGKTRGYAYWERFKGMMFKRHKQVRLRVGAPVVVLQGDQAFVGFDQWFDSDKMQSFGRKTLEWVREQGGWKITSEHFAVKKFFNKLRASGSESGAVTEADFSKPDSLTYPIVVHASTKLNLGEAVEVLNELRARGWHAYIAPLYVTPVKKIYRVLVGRQSDWNGAEEMTRQIRRMKASRFAAPKRFPFALMAGEFLQEGEAEALAEALRQKGVSAYLHSAGGGNFPNPVTQVLVGAFLEKENAERYAGELAKAGIGASLVSP